MAAFTAYAHVRIWRSAQWRCAALPGVFGRLSFAFAGDESREMLNPCWNQEQWRGWNQYRAGMGNGLAERAVFATVVDRRFTI